MRYGKLFSVRGGVLSFALAWALASPVTAAVYVEDSPAAEELIRKAERARDADRPAQAARHLQQVIEQYPRKLLERRAGLYVDAMTAVRGRLEANPALAEAHQSLFGAKAQRLLDEALKRAPRLGALQRVANRYPVTGAGLEASLVAAGLYLERGDGEAAASVLDPLAGHPRLEGERARYHHLQAIAGLLAGDASRVERHRAKLEQLGATARQDELGSLRQSLTESALAPAEARLIDAGAKPAAAETEPIWTFEWLRLDQPRSDRANRLVERRQSLLERVPPASHPEVNGGTVYVNGHRTVHAIDRVSGRVAWRYERSRDERDRAGGDEGERFRHQLAALLRGQSVIRPRGVLAREASVYAVVGMGLDDHRREGDGEGSRDRTAVVALDRASGEPRWRTPASQLEPGLARVQFYGTPRASGDRLFVLASRGSERASTDVFLLALDRGEGSLLWQRHVASLMATAQVGPLPVRLRVARGRLFLTGPSGMAGVVEPRTGGFVWLRVPRQEGQGGGADDRWGRRRQGDDTALSGRAVLTEAGLLVSRPSDSEPPMLLAPATGRSVRPISKEEWAGKQQLYSVAGDVLAISEQQITRFDGESLEVQWQRSLSSPLRERGLSPAITRQFVAVLTEAGIEARSLESGEAVLRKPMEPTGHLVATRDQLLVAGRERLHSFMTWEAARPALTRRMERSPADPAPALSLAYLARETGHVEALLKAADRAVAALDRSGQGDREAPAKRQAKVFDALLELAREHEALSHAQRRQMFERVAAVAKSPSQQIAYHLAIGELLIAMEKAQAAVRHYQTVLNQPQLAGERIEVDGTRRHAGLEARSRLRQLIDRHGQAIYATYADDARQRFETLRQRNAGAEALLELAARYPFAQAATEARYHAAGRLMEAGQSNQAAFELRRAYQRARDDSLRARIATRLTTLYLDGDRPGRASEWLHRVARQHPALKLTRNGEPTTAKAWLERLDSADARVAGPPAVADEFGPARLVRGRVMPVAGKDAPADRVLLRDGDGLILRQGPSLRERWRAQLPTGGSWRLLRLSDEQVVLWSPNQPRVLVLNGQTGERAWPMLEARSLLAEEVGEPPRRRPELEQDQARRLRLGEQGGQRGVAVRLAQLARQGEEGGERRVYVSSTPSVLTVIGRHGRAVGLAVHTGKVLWRAQLGVEQVSSVTARSRAIAVAGLHATGRGSSRARVTLLDPITGERIRPPLEPAFDGLPQWLGFVGERLLVAGESDVQAYRVGDGQMMWRHTLAGGQFIGRGFAGHRWLGLMVQLGASQHWQLFAPGSGEPLSELQFDPPQTLNRATTPQRCHLLGLRRAVAVGPDGRVRWRDAIALPDKRLLGQRLTRRYVALLARPASEPAGDDEARSGERGLLCLLERSTGRIARTYRLPARFDNDTLAAPTPVAGGFAIAGDGQTLLIPAAEK